MGKAAKHLVWMTSLLVAWFAMGCEQAPTVSAISIEGKSLVNIFTLKPIPLPTIHLRHNGEDVKGVVPIIKAQNENVVRVEGDQIIPVGNGSTSIDVTVAGNKTTASLGILVKIVDDMELSCRPRSCQTRQGDLINVTAELTSNGVPEFTDVEFKSENPELLEHLGEGKFVGKKMGMATIAVSLGDLVRKKKIRVTPPPPDEIVIRCARPKLTFKTKRGREHTNPEKACNVRRGKSTSLDVEVRAAGVKLPVRQPEFRSSDRSIVDIDGPIMHGRRKGSAVITALLDGMSVSLIMEVR